MSTPTNEVRPQSETTTPEVALPGSVAPPATATGPVAATPNSANSPNAESRDPLERHSDVEENDADGQGTSGSLKTKKKGKNRSIPKELRKNKKNWAEGVRSTILSAHIDGYAKAKRLGRSQADEYMQRVLNEYHFHIPALSSDLEEPPLPLRKYDPKAPLPDDSHLTDEERLARATYYAESNKASDSRVRNWLDYRVKSTRHRAKKNTEELKQAYGGIMAKLAGSQPSSRPRLGYQQLMRDDFQTRIAPLLPREWERLPTVDEKGNPKAPKASFGFGAVVARKLWDDELPERLTEEEKKEYEARAREEFEDGKAEREARQTAEPDKTPRGRQTAIDNVDGLAQMFCEGVADATGLQVVLLLGGPIPEFGGDIRTICIAVGENMAAAPVSFPEWPGNNFDKNTVKPFKEYLATAYSQRECAAASLPPSECVGYEGDEEMDISDTEPAASSSKTRPSKSSALARKTKTTSKAATTTVATTGKGKGKGKGKEKEVAGSESQTIAEASAKILNDRSLERMSVDPGAERGGESPPRDRDSEFGSDYEEFTDDEDDGEDNADGSQGKRKATGEDGRAKKRRKLTEEEKARREHLAWQKKRDYMRSVEEAKAKNLKLLEAIGLKEAAAGFGKPKPKPRAARRPRPAPEGPPRRSGRNAAAESVGDVQAPGDGAETVPGGDLEGGGGDVDESRAAGERDEPSAEESAISAIACPSDAGEWLKAKWEQITGPDGHMDEVWAELLRDFLELEREYGWEDSGDCLSTKSRPDAVSAWVRNGRRANTKIDIRNLDTYENRWWGWWRSNQPTWRRSGGEDAPLTRPDADGGSWQPLKAPGQNGMLLVVASLFWWGRTEKERRGSQSTGWGQAVEEVRWAIRRLTLAARVA